jgi:bifunctional DNase/RNase
MLVEAAIWTLARTNQGNAILVRPQGSQLVVPIFIGQLEAQSILIGMEKVPMPRPLTHDLLLNILENNKEKITRIEITDLRQGTYMARILIESPKGELELDSRPSDAVALAVRVKCPIFIDEAVVDEAGININQISETDDQNDISPLIERQRELHQELQKSVEEERYEDSARIRDELEEIKKQLGEELDEN